MQFCILAEIESKCVYNATTSWFTGQGIEKWKASCWRCWLRE